MNSNEQYPWQLSEEEITALQPNIESEKLSKKQLTFAFLGLCIAGLLFWLQWVWLMPDYLPKGNQSPPKKATSELIVMAVPSRNHLMEIKVESPPVDDMIIPVSFDEPIGDDFEEVSEPIFNLMGIGNGSDGKAAIVKVEFEDDTEIIEVSEGSSLLDDYVVNSIHDDHVMVKEKTEGALIRVD